MTRSPDLTGSASAQGPGGGCVVAGQCLAVRGLRQAEEVAPGPGAVGLSLSASLVRPSEGGVHPRGSSRGRRVAQFGECLDPAVGVRRWEVPPAPGLLQPPPWRGIADQHGQACVERLEDRDAVVLALGRQRERVGSRQRHRDLWVAAQAVQLGATTGWKGVHLGAAAGGEGGIDLGTEDIEVNGDACTSGRGDVVQELIEPLLDADGADRDQADGLVRMAGHAVRLRRRCRQAGRGEHRGHPDSRAGKDRPDDGRLVLVAGPPGHVSPETRQPAEPQHDLLLPGLLAQGALEQLAGRGQDELGGSGEATEPVQGQRREAAGRPRTEEQHHIGFYLADGGPHIADGGPPERDMTDLRSQDVPRVVVPSPDGHRQAGAIAEVVVAGQHPDVGCPGRGSNRSDGIHDGSTPGGGLVVLGDHENTTPGAGGHRAIVPTGPTSSGRLEPRGGSAGTIADGEVEPGYRCRSTPNWSNLEHANRASPREVGVRPRSTRPEGADDSSPHHARHQ